MTEIREGVKADYQEALEEHKDALSWAGLKKERAASTAEFLAVWVAPKYDPSKRNDVHLLDIQRRYWELALWLDTPALRSLNTALQGKGNHLEALIIVRDAIGGRDQEHVAAEELIRWKPGSLDPDTEAAASGTEAPPPKPSLGGD